MIAAPIANMESQRKVKTYSLCVKNDDAASPYNLGFAFLNNINKFSSRNNNLGADIILYTNWWSLSSSLSTVLANMREKDRKYFA